MAVHRFSTTARLAATLALTFASAPTQTQDRTPQPISFGIRAGHLTDGLVDFAKQSGCTVQFPAGESNKQQTAGVSGRLPPLNALKKLLSGTTLSLDLEGHNFLRLKGKKAENYFVTFIPEKATLKFGPPDTHRESGRCG